MSVALRANRFSNKTSCVLLTLREKEEDTWERLFNSCVMMQCITSLTWFFSFLLLNEQIYTQTKNPDRMNRFSNLGTSTET